jgi:hypothetical protein
VLVAAAVGAAEPWVITQPVTITAPMRWSGDIVVASGGRLEIRDVAAPGFELTGNLLVVGNGELTVSGSAFRVLSAYHGQFFVAAAERGRITVADSDYRVPAGVQHAIMALGESVVELRDTDFGSNQLLAGDHATLDARRLDGDFEVLLQHAARLTLADIPRTPGKGALWVWPEFPAGSTAVYTPPLPGAVAHWTFPPPGASGIDQQCTMERCVARLWPFLVRAGSDLTVRDVPESNWVVIGVHLPADAEIAALRNGETYTAHELDLADRRLRLENATVDTWNFYPQADARVTFRDALLGEILAMERSEVALERVTIDGSGGYFGIEGDAVVEAHDSVFTCDVQVSDRGTGSFRRCRLLPYPGDATGAWTRFGAHDDGRLLLDASEATSTPTVGGRGAIAVAGIADAPAFAPPLGHTAKLHGWAALFTLDPALLPLQWRLEAVATGRAPVLLGVGSGNVEGGPLGTWSDAEPWRAWTLRVVLADAIGRALVGLTEVAPLARVRGRLAAE